jgi:hypothetical protein
VFLRAVIQSVVRITSAGVCNVWYYRSDSTGFEIEMEDESQAVDGYGESAESSALAGREPAVSAAMASNPTLVFFKRSMTESFGSAAVAALLASDWRTSRAIFGSLQYGVAFLSSSCSTTFAKMFSVCRAKMKDSKSCFASLVRWIVRGLDKIIHYFNYYAYTQVRHFNGLLACVPTKIELKLFTSDQSSDRCLSKILLHRCD